MMKLATTTGDFDLFCDTYLERVKQVQAAGFSCIDLGFSAGQADELLYDANWQKHVEELKTYADENGLQFVQAHSPCNGHPLIRDDRYERFIAGTKRSIEVCAMLGIPRMVVHAGHVEDKQTFFEKNRAFFLEMLDVAEKFGVELLHENSSRGNMGKFYWTNTGEEMMEFIRYVGHPLLHAVWDTGHGHMDGRQYEHILALKDELRALHVHDNSGRGDEHVIPYLGTLNWDELMHALIDANYDGYFTMEATTSLRPGKYWQGNRNTFEADTRLFEPTLRMQQCAEKLLFCIGEEMLSAYGLLEK